MINPFNNFSFFFFNDTATTEIYTLSLHDALPISRTFFSGSSCGSCGRKPIFMFGIDRKSTRLNSSHLGISYAVFCLKKKKKKANRLLHILQQSFKRKSQTNISTITLFQLQDVCLS